jgi:hypothetical protein
MAAADIITRFGSAATHDPVNERTLPGRTVGTPSCRQPASAVPCGGNVAFHVDAHGTSGSAAGEMGSVVEGSVVGTVVGCVTGGDVVAGGVVGGADGRGIVTVGGRVVGGATVTVGGAGGAAVTVGGAGAVDVTVGGPADLRGVVPVEVSTVSATGTSGVGTTSSALSLGGATPTSVVSEASICSPSAAEPFDDESTNRDPRSPAELSGSTDAGGGRVRIRSGDVDSPCHGLKNNTIPPTQMVTVAARNGAFQIQECSRTDCRSSWRIHQRDMHDLPSTTTRACVTIGTPTAHQSPPPTR